MHLHLGERVSHVMGKSWTFLQAQHWSLYTETIISSRFGLHPEIETLTRYIHLKEGQIF
jgi:hypothetical protein